MSAQTTELIWHFIGYLHIEELLNRPAIVFDGAYISTDEVVFTYSGGVSLGNIKIESPDSTRPSLIDVDDIKDAAPTLIDFDSLSISRSAPYTPEQLKFLAIDNAPANQLGTGGFQGPLPPDFKINLTYTYGDDSAEFLTIYQSNSLLNDDELISSAANGASKEFDFDVPELLMELVETAQESLSELSLNPFNHTLDEIADMMEAAGEQAIIDAEEELENPPDEEPEPLEGKYVNGEKQPDEIEAADNGDDEDGSGDTEDEIDADDDTGNDEPQELHVVTYANEPTGGAAQIAELGANEAINSAVMADYSDSYGSIIVEGDVFSTNAIIQANILHDNDAIGFSGMGLVENATGGENVTENIAEFVFDTTSVAGNPAFGNLPIGLNWNVDYINGDVYDVSMSIQENYMVDNDIVQQTATNTHFMATTGGNSQTDQLSLFEYGTTYDLVIVAGNVYEFNAIIQYNVLLDDDILELYADGSANTTMSTNAGGNVLTNDASIVNVGGGTRFSELGGIAEALAEQVGNEVGEIDADLAFGINGNGSNTLNVLYISGNLYDLHAIYQMNVMTDLDFASQEMESDDNEDGEGPEVFSQEISSGGNTLTNSAIIYDVDSTSNYQFLGGEFYEDSLLIQTEMVTSEDDISFDDETELVATTVAILTGNNEDGGASPDDHGPETTGPGGEDDMMGGMLA